MHIRSLLASALLVVGCAQQAPPSALPHAPSASIAANSSRLTIDGRSHGRLEVSVSGPVKRGEIATAVAAAVPGSRCEIAVSYASGPSEAKGLTARDADPDGVASWSWTVGLRTTLGSWPVEVSCTAPDGATARGRAALEVTD